LSDYSNFDNSKHSSLSEAPATEMIALLFVSASMKCASLRSTATFDSSTSMTDLPTQRTALADAPNVIIDTCLITRTFFVRVKKMAEIKGVFAMILVCEPVPSDHFL
jgi:hypothetical protein